MLGGAYGRRSAADEKAGFDVLGDAGLGKVGAGDQQDAAVGDGQLGVHLRARLGPLRRGQCQSSRPGTPAKAR